MSDARSLLAEVDAWLTRNGTTVTLDWKARVSAFLASPIASGPTLEGLRTGDGFPNTIVFDTPAAAPLDVERLARVYTHVRNAHGGNGTSRPDDEPGAPPCDWCRLAAQQHIEAQAAYENPE